MGCGVSRGPLSNFEANSLHAAEEFPPNNKNNNNIVNNNNNNIEQDENVNENGVSSERPSIDNNSTDSPPPRPTNNINNDSYTNNTNNNNTNNNNNNNNEMIGVDRLRSASPAPGLSEYASLPLRHIHKKLKHNHRVFRICLTGGPCAGKSTFLTQLQSKMLQRAGYKVYCVPEAATLLVTGGMEWEENMIEEQQLALLRTQIALEDQFYNIALTSGKPSIVISDRGTMDGRAFCSDEIFCKILKRLHVTLETLRDRYDAVLHLVTAAAGAEEFYNFDNPARYESIEGAIESDKKLRQVYIGHPMLRIIDNSTTFEEKMERALALVGQIIGQKFSMQNTSYYLLRHCPNELPVKYATCTLTITMLCNSQFNDIRMLIKRKHTSGESMYFFNSIKNTNGKRSHNNNNNNNSFGEGNNESLTRDSSPIQNQEDLHAMQNAFMWMESGQRIKNEQRISSKEYNSLIRHRDSQRRDVVLHAIQFIYNNNRYEVTTIVEPAWAAGKQAMTLECDEEETTNAIFPSFIKVDREVPIDNLSTSFLISHLEMGPLYTSLAYAPVFKREINIIAKGAHADAENFADSTCISLNSRNSSVVSMRAGVNNTPVRDSRKISQKMKRKIKETQQEEKKEKENNTSEVVPLLPVEVNTTNSDANNTEISKPSNEGKLINDENENNKKIDDKSLEGVNSMKKSSIEPKRKVIDRFNQKKLGPIKSISKSPTQSLTSSPPPPPPPPIMPSGPSTSNPRGSIVVNQN